MFRKFLGLILTILILLMSYRISYSLEAEIYEDIPLEEMTIAQLEETIAMFDKAIIIDPTQVLILSSSGSYYGVCTGTVIKNEEKGAVILTARHCLGDSTNFIADNVEVTGGSISLTQDLALLYTSTPLHRLVATLAQYDVLQYDYVHGLGYASSKKFPFGGLVEITATDSYFVRMVVKGGCSGAAVFNEKNEVSGVLTSGIPSFGWGIYIPIQKVHEFLNEVGYE